MQMRQTTKTAVFVSFLLILACTQKSEEVVKKSSSAIDCSSLNNVVDVRWVDNSLRRLNQNIICTNKDIIVRIKNISKENVSLPCRTQFQYFVIRGDDFNRDATLHGPGTANPASIVSGDRILCSTDLQPNESIDFKIPVKLGLTGFTDFTRNYEFAQGAHKITIEFRAGQIRESILMKWTGNNFPLTTWKR